PETRLEQPVDVAVGADGAIYAADLRDRVVKLDPTSDVISATWKVPVGTALGASNLALKGPFLFLTDPNRKALAVVDTRSGQIERFGSAGPFGLPLGVAVGPDGR